MTNFVKSVFYISVCIAIGTSCKEEVAGKMSYNDSYGSWRLSEALKDGKSTMTLEGTTFDIDSAKITTNLFGGERSYSYEREGSRIKLMDNVSQIFKVEKTTSDTLILSMERKRKTFELLMVKEDIDNQ